MVSKLLWVWYRTICFNSDTKTLTRRNLSNEYCVSAQDTSTYRLQLHTLRPFFKFQLLLGLPWSSEGSFLSCWLLAVVLAAALSIPCQLCSSAPSSSSSTHKTKHHHSINHAKTTNEQTTSSQPRYHNTNHAKIAQGHTTSSSSP
jgi:hypothetical protein